MEPRKQSRDYKDKDKDFKKPKVIKVKKYRTKNLLDPVHSDELVAKLINSIMLDGKKNTACKIVYSALEKIGKETGENSVEVLKTAIENLKPKLEVKSRRVGGSTYQVPIDVRPARRRSLALRWLTLYSRQRKERGMENCLAGEILDAYKLTGNAMKKKEDVHKMADANRAFSHYNW